MSSKCFRKCVTKKTQHIHYSYVGISGGVGLLHAYMSRDSLEVICPPCFLQTSLSTGITSLGTPANIILLVYNVLSYKKNDFSQFLFSLGPSPIVFNAFQQQSLWYQSISSCLYNMDSMLYYFIQSFAKYIEFIHLIQEVDQPCHQCRFDQPNSWSISQIFFF